MTGHSRRSFCNGNLCSRYNFTYNYSVELVTTRCDCIKMVPFADDFSATRKLRSPFQLWTALLEIGPKFGYYLQPTKSWLITNFETHVLVKELFKNTKVKITNSGKRYLDSVIGTVTFKKQYADEIASQWISEKS